jgi:alpha-glucuronidase
MSFGKRFTAAKRFMLIALSVLMLCLLSSLALAEDGSDLWLRYVMVSDTAKLAAYQATATQIVVQNYTDTTTHPTLGIIRDELNMGLDGLLGKDVPDSDTVTADGAVIVGTPTTSTIIAALNLSAALDAAGNEGFIIRTTTSNSHSVTVIASNTEVGALYGTFAYLRLIQTQQSVATLNISESPKIKLRQLDHWETERCYAFNPFTETAVNFITWGSDSSPDIDVTPTRYKTFARACASLGINAFVFNNVNTQSKYGNANYIQKEAALADIFRPYGIKVFLVLPFNTPKNQATPSGIGFEGLNVSPQLATADPLDAGVIQWWKDQAAAIYKWIPDFGGFLIKAGSEGQSGPGDYARSHAEGANCLARAVKPYGGIVLWRSFVYDAGVDPDRLKRCYLDFHPLDGKFDENVFVQSKNTPMDFQPREAYNPLFSGLPNTNQAAELQITQEYTGHNKKLCYLGTMWEEFLQTPTYVNGLSAANSTVAKILDGSVFGNDRTAIVGVANIGNTTNLVGHPFSGANWYAFGRLAWNHDLTAKDIAEEWTRMTWTNDATAVNTIVTMMMGSRESLVNHQEPLGLISQQSQTTAGDHYTPGPSEVSSNGSNLDWYSQYYNRADTVGLGYDRTTTGGNMVSQYLPSNSDNYNDIDKCPENLLMYFHHVPYKKVMKSGRTFWDELTYLYQVGTDYVTAMRAQWDSVQNQIDAERFAYVQQLLAVNETDAQEWRDTCIDYFQKFSNLPVKGDPLTLKKIYVNGVEVEFDPYVHTLTVPVKGAVLPNLTAEANGENLIDTDAVTMKIAQATAVPGSATVTLATEVPVQGHTEVVYTINFIDDCSLSDLQVNDTTIDGFSPDTYDYDMMASDGPTTLPVVTATTSDPAASVEITQATVVPGSAQVVVTNNQSISTYNVNFDFNTAKSDEFNSTTLGSQWKWVREDSANWSLSSKPGYMTITPQTGDLTGSTNTAQNVLLQDISGNWTIDSKLVFSGRPNAATEQGGIIAYQDDDNFVKVDWEATTYWWWTKEYITFVKEVNGTATSVTVNASNIISSTGDNPNTVWFRIVKKGDSYTAYYSADGGSFVKIGSVTAAFTGLKVGLIAANGNSSGTDLNVSFDYFRINNSSPVVTTPSASTLARDAILVSNDIPDTMSVGQTYTVKIRVANNGTETWTENQKYRLGAVNDSDPFTKTIMRGFLGAGESVAKGQSKEFTFTMKAPDTAGTYTTDWRMVQDGVTWFGPTLVKTVTVEASDEATILKNDIPYSLDAGKDYKVTIQVLNTGNTTWTKAGLYRLGAVGDSDDLSPTPRILLNDGDAIAPGQSKAFSFIIHAPATAGSYSTDWRMVKEGSHWFGDTLTRSTTVREAIDADITGNTFPTTMVAGRTYNVSITVKNTGNISWNKAELYRLGAVGDSDPLGAPNRLLLNDSRVNNGKSYTFTFSIKAPSTPGNYTSSWRMLREGVTWFGETYAIPVTVVSGAEIVSHTIPTTMKAGDTVMATITVRNTGLDSWTESDLYRLGGVSDANPFLSFQRILLESSDSVATGDEHTFTVRLTAPSTPGTYTCGLQMLQEAIGWFGDTFSQDIQVNL